MQTIITLGVLGLACVGGGLLLHSLFPATGASLRKEVTFPTQQPSRFRWVKWLDKKLGIKE